MRSEIISRLRVYGREAYSNAQLANFTRRGQITLDDIYDVATFLSTKDKVEIARLSDTPSGPNGSPENTPTADIIGKVEEVFDDSETDWQLPWDQIAYEFIVNESNNKEHTAPQQAQAISDKLKQMLSDGAISKQQIYDYIAKDHNLLGIAHIKRLVNDNVLTYKGLNKYAQIDSSFINKLIMDTSASEALFRSPQTLDNIHTESTEIYFWGIPSSGKSCIIGAILSCLADIPNVTITPKVECNGFDYLTTLRDCFSTNDIISLPPGTKTQDFYEMGFDLVDEKNKRHPITMIDLAGELVKAIYVKNTEPKSLNDSHRQALSILDNILGSTASKNHKIHFFVVEYGAERKFYEGHTQLAYLQSTIAYLNNLNVFTRNTDAIYLIVTKTDKAPFARDPDRMVRYKEYVDTQLGQFSNALYGICRDKKNEIGIYDRFLFTLGDVCFRKYCRVNRVPAIQITKEIIQTTGISRSWGRFLDGLLG